MDQSNNSNWYIITVCWQNATPEAKRSTWIIFYIWLPLALIQIYGLYSQVKRDHVPVYVINLLISDALQICCTVVAVAIENNFTIFSILNYVYGCFVTASVFFMTLISMERYLFIVWPLWYKSRQTTKASVSVSIVSWILSVCIGIIQGNSQGGALVVPLPFLIFFLVQTLRALSAAQGVSSNEKRRIVVVLVVVLLTYIVIFLPQAILLALWDFFDSFDYGNLMNFLGVSCILLQLNPLADLVLYVFIKKWAVGKLLALICCRKKQSQTTTTLTTTSGIVSQVQNSEENNP